MVNNPQIFQNFLGFGLERLIYYPLKGVDDRISCNENAVSIYPLTQQVLAGTGSRGEMKVTEMICNEPVHLFWKGIKSIICPQTGLNMTYCDTKVMGCDGGGHHRG